MSFDVHIIGGGLAGSEAAWQLAEAGLKVRLSEMRGGGDMTPAHETDRLAEMVCSNSFRSDDAENNAVGLLHQEMRALGSLIMRAADAAQACRPARRWRSTATAFAAEVTARHRRPSQYRGRARAGRRPARLRPDDHRHRAADRARRSPRRSPKATGSDALAFFDAIAPIVHRDSIDMDDLLDGGALGQGRQGLHQLPDDEGAV